MKLRLNIKHALIPCHLKKMDHSSLISEVEEFVRADLKNVDCSHDWNHICRVRSNVSKVLKGEQASGRFLSVDPLVLQLAALMHDVGDFKYTKDHSAGPRMVKECLMKHLNLGVSEEQIEKVCQIIANISYRHELSHGMSSILPEELLIVQDADRLDAIGAAGITRCFAYSGAIKRPFYQKSEQFNTEMTAEEYNRQTEANRGTALGHFYEKLFKLKDLMKTETGRQMAIERNNFMVEFVKAFSNECDIPCSL
jgi:uncharacterized protein